MMFGVHFEDPVASREVYREAISEDADDTEIERMRQYTVLEPRYGAVSPSRGSANPPTR